MKLLLKIFPYIVIAILVILLLRACNKPQWQERPKVESVKSQKAKVDTIVKEDTRKTDSIAKELEHEKQNVETLSVINQAIQSDYAKLQYKVQEQAKKDCPSLTPELNNLAAEKMKSDLQHSKIVTSLNKQISLKGAQIAQKDGTIKKLLSKIDTCLLNQTTLQKSNNKLKPRNQFYVGAEAFGNPVKVLAGYGLNVGLRFKNGTMVQLKVLQVGNQTCYGAGLSVPISFRK